MNPRKVLIPALLAGSAFTLLRRISSGSAAAKSNPSSGRYDAIDAYIEHQMRRLGIPGIALAIVEGEQVVYRRGFGRDRPGGETPTPQTPFMLGSTTKSFTALAVMQLVEAGNVELDAPLKRYLPWFRVADAEASSRITVRHLLQQTSGMSALAGTVCLADIDDRPDAAERQARSLATLRLSRPPGSTFQYCNLNFNLLGLVIETASGQSYEEYLQEHILGPLGMSSTCMYRPAPKPKGLALGHRYWFGFPIASPNMPFPLSSLAAGGLISTSEDMARYLIAHLNGGRCGEVQILSRASMDAMHRPSAEQYVLGKPVTAYGMGWFISKIDGGTLVSHGGNVPEYSSFIGLLPDQKKGVVLLTNSDHGFPFILMEVGEGVAALLAGHQPRATRLGATLPWMARAALLIPMVQAAGVLAFLKQLQRWRRDPESRPSRRRMWTLQLLLPLIPNLSLTASLIYLRASGLLRFMRLYMPDLAWIIRICGGFAGVWTFLRTGLMLRIARDEPS